MDHLLTAETRRAGYGVQVPYLGEHFNNSPKTSNLFLYARDSKFAKDGLLDLDSASHEEAAGMLQRWLFFEFLREFCLVQKITFADNVFTTTTSEGKVILHTFGLPGLIQLWSDKEASRPLDERDSMAERVEKTKSIINFARHNVFSVTVRPGADTFNIVLASIQVLGYTITSALKLRFSWEFLAFHPGFGSPKILIDRLVSRQWCPRDIAMLKNDYFPDSQLYCTMITPPRKDFSHMGCSDLECKAMNIDESTYRTQHVSKGCDCVFLETPLTPLHQLVNQLSIPLVRYQPPNIEITDLKKDEPNVVFSHVWADGLGNVSGKNALPTCQIARLQELANSAFNRHDSEPVPFYIDTMCVPREMALRRKAIKKMRDVYQSAKKVVVLDREIEALSTNDSIVHKALRIIFSGWMRRLWTYQEGAINKSLFFKLSDCILPLTSIRRESWLSEALKTAEGGCAIHLLSMISQTLEVRDPKMIPPPLFFAVIRDALHWRSTSRPEDEAIVLSILLGHDTEILQEIDGTKRMKLVLQRVGRVPLPLVVLSSDRMEDEGYTWAPKSFLALKTDSIVGPLSSWYSKMLRINPNISEGVCHNEFAVADVLENGALSFKVQGYAIFPGGLAPKRITSPFWLGEVTEFHGEARTPVATKFWRVQFENDLKGFPEPLPQEVFFLVPVEDPSFNSWHEYLSFRAFIVLASQETRDFVLKHYWDQELSIDVLPGTFYCRVSVWMVSLQILQAQPLWRAEYFNADDRNVHLVRSINAQNWILS